MAYELFHRTNTRVDTPTLAITVSGRIALNAAAVRILVAIGAKSVLLFWDKENRKLAMKAVHEKDRNAFVVSIVRNTSAKLWAKSFLAHIGWSAPRRETMAATWDAQKEMFEVTLPLNCLRTEKSSNDPDEQELSAIEEREIDLYLRSTSNGTVPLTIEQLYKAFAMKHTVRSPRKTQEFMESFFVHNKHAIKKTLKRNGEAAYLWKRGS
jgi:hypothetical protein